MLIEIILTCFFAKIRKHKLQYLFYSWTFYPILLVQIFVAVLQFSLFFHTDRLVFLSPTVEPAIILSFLFAIFIYKIYTPAVVGSALIVVGSLLNKFVIFQNNGKMPVYPTLSYLTGYVTTTQISQMDNIHILGNDFVKFKILTDYIDFGYCILSIGDILIHMFFCILFYNLIKEVNLKYNIKRSI